MTFQAKALLLVQDGQAMRGDTDCYHPNRPPHRWKGIEQEVLCKMAAGEGLNDIYDANSSCGGAILVALNLLAKMGLINTEGDRIVVTNMGFEAASEFERKVA